VLRVLAPELDAPIQTGNEELFQVCARHCTQVMRSIPEAGLLHSRLRSMFLARPANLPDLKEASASLGVSVTTLRRQLLANGQSYQTIKDEFRFDLACEYLRSGHMGPKQVSYLIGFKTPSAFYRAFRGWSGMTTVEFMRSEKR
jgi:AraC-like DNA-binding protein